MGKSEIQKKVRHLLTEFLQKNNYRKTPERYHILEVIYDIDHGHYDVDSLYKILRERGMFISKATLYNTLELLLEAGLIRKHYFSHNSAFYEKRFFSGSHHHLIILNEKGEVKEIKEFCDPRVDAVRQDLEKLFNVKVTDNDLYFYATAKTESDE